MAPVELSETPPTSPSHSPPRKKAKFSLRLKGKIKGKKDEDENVDLKENQRTSNFYPIFRSPMQENGDVSDTNIQHILPSFALAGLLNRGNVCYANAVLQVLRRCPGFERFVTVLAEDIKILENTEDSNKHIKFEPKYLINQLSKLLSQMSVCEADFLKDKENCIYLRNKGANSLVLAAEPNDFMIAFRDLYPSFECNLQHDAQEFLCSLIMSLQESANEITKHRNNNNNNNLPASIDIKTTSCTISNESSDPPNLHTKHSLTNEEKLCSKYSASCSENSCQNESACDQVESFQRDAFIKSLFQGKLVHQTKCLNCEQSKLRYEDIQEVSVPVVEDQPYLDARKKLMLSPTPKKDKTDVHTLQWAISQFASSECLQGDNKYFCENCNTYCEARISTSFEELPTVLTVHLKRFTSSIGLSSKITSNLKTPLVLSVQEWCSDKCQKQDNTYELFGIVLHSGISSGSGHYETYVRIPGTKEQKQEDAMVVDNGDVHCAYNEKVSNSIEDQSEIESSVIADGTTPMCVENIDSRTSNSDEGQRIDKTCTSNVNNEMSENIRVSSVNRDRLNDAKTASNTTSNEENCSINMQNLYGTDTASTCNTADINNKNTSDDSTTNEVKKTETNVNQNHTDKGKDKEDIDEPKKFPRRTLRPRKAKKSSSASQVEESSENSAEESKIQQESECTKDDKSPLNAKEKPSCISLITKYFQRSKQEPKKTEAKRTLKREHDKQENTSSVVENTEGKKSSPKKVRTIEDSFKKISSYTSPKPSTIRKLDFVCGTTKTTTKGEQDSQEDDNNMRLNNTSSFYPEELTTEWIHFDDCTVDNVTNKDIVHVLSASESSYVSPYLLFYQKKDCTR